MAELQSKTRELTADEMANLSDPSLLTIARPFVSIDDAGGQWLCWERVIDTDTAEAWRERAL